MKYKFGLLVFQDGVLDEEVGIIKEFADATELAYALAGFAAQESGVRLHHLVRPIYDRWKFHLPPLKHGLGPTTYVVIGEIKQV